MKAFETVTGKNYSSAKEINENLAEHFRNYLLEKLTG